MSVNLNSNGSLPAKLLVAVARTIGLQEAWRFEPRRLQQYVADEDFFEALSRAYEDRMKYDYDILIVGDDCLTFIWDEQMTVDHLAVSTVMVDRLMHHKAYDGSDNSINCYILSVERQVDLLNLMETTLSYLSYDKELFYIDLSIRLEDEEEDLPEVTLPARNIREFPKQRRPESQDLSGD